MKKKISLFLSMLAITACIATPSVVFANSDVEVTPYYVTCPVTGGPHYYQYNDSAAYYNYSQGSHTYYQNNYQKTCNTSTTTKYTPGACACGTTHTMVSSSTWHSSCGK